MLTSNWAEKQLGDLVLEKRCSAQGEAEVWVGFCPLATLLLCLLEQWNEG